jgi:hypothetical protein
MIICKECGAEIEDYHRLSLHIIKHKLSSKDYYDKHLKTPDEGVCQCCGKPAKFNNLREGYLKWCCRACRDKDPAFRKTLSNAVKQSYTDDLLASRKQNMLRRWASGDMEHVRSIIGNMWTMDEKRRELSEKIKKSEKHQAIYKSKHWIEAQSESHVKLWNEHRCFMKYEFNGVKYHSSWEIYFAYYLQKNNIEYEYQCKPITYFFEGAKHKYIPDFCVNGELIEIKGSHLLNYMKNGTDLEHAKYECMIANNVKIITNVKEYQKIFEQDFGKNFIASLKRK